MYLEKYAYTPPVILPDTGMKSSSAFEITNPVKKSYPKIRLYPDPAYDYVIVEILKGNVTGAAMTVIDNNGREVLTAELPARTQHTVIPLKSLSKGLYLVKVEYEGVTIGTKKLTVLK
jgi:hypothetical protein